MFIGQGPGADAKATYPERMAPHAVVSYGTAVYDGHPASFDEYHAAVVDGLPGDLGVFLGLKQHADVRSNVYLAGATPFEREQDALVVDAAVPGLSIETRDDGVYVALPVPFSPATRSGSCQIGFPSRRQ